jgi:hypothetical protein
LSFFLTSICHPVGFGNRGGFDHRGGFGGGRGGFDGPGRGGFDGGRGGFDGPGRGGFDGPGRGGFDGGRGGFDGPGRGGFDGGRGKLLINFSVLNVNFIFYFCTYGVENRSAAHFFLCSHKDSESRTNKASRRIWRILQLTFSLINKHSFNYSGNYSREYCVRFNSFFVAAYLQCRNIIIIMVQVHTVCDKSTSGMLIIPPIVW